MSDRLMWIWSTTSAIDRDGEIDSDRRGGGEPQEQQCAHQSRSRKT
jgi:hypothetical protein